MEEEISGWLLVYYNKSCFCGGWKKRYCTLTRDGDFKVMISSTQSNSVVLNEPRKNFIEAYKNLVDRKPNIFTIVFTDEILKLQAYTEFSMNEWLSILKPNMEINNLLEQTKKYSSREFMSIKEFIDENEEFWYRSISIEDRKENDRNTMKDTVKILDSIINRVYCKSAFDNLISASHEKK